MNTSTRRQKIEAMLADEPDDAFLRYALAMELAKEGDHRRSLAQLRELMQEDPPHVPSFSMAAQQLVHQGEIDPARSVLRDGIEAARRAGENHAASEMGELLATLGHLPG